MDAAPPPPESRLAPEIGVAGARPHLLSGRAGRALAVLTAAGVVAQLDRYVVSALFERLRVDLWLTDARLGLLGTVFIAVYALAAPRFEALGERRRRPALLALGAVVLGAGTVLSGLARGYWALLAARAAVGAGEAAFGAVAPGLLADGQGEARRPRALAFFGAALPLGAALGYMAGGLFDRALGWRAAFFAAGAPALVVALACLTVRDHPRGRARGGWTIPGGAGMVGAYRRLSGNRRYVLAVAGHAAQAFAVAGMSWWMPAFLERTRGVSRGIAAVEFGAIVIMTAFLGTFMGGQLAQALRSRGREARLWVCGVTAVAAAPAALVAFVTFRPAIYLVALVAAQLLLFASSGLASAAIVATVPPAERAPAVAFSVRCVHLLGHLPAPFIIGFVSDRSSLGRALLLVPAAILVAGVLWTSAALGGERAGKARPVGV